MNDSQSCLISQPPKSRLYPIPKSHHYCNPYCFYCPVSAPYCCISSASSVSPCCTKNMRFNEIIMNTILCLITENRVWYITQPNNSGFKRLPTFSWLKSNVTIARNLIRLNGNMSNVGTEYISMSGEWGGLRVIRGRGSAEFKTLMVTEGMNEKQTGTFPFHYIQFTNLLSRCDNRTNWHVNWLSKYTIWKETMWSFYFQGGFGYHREYAGRNARLERARWAGDMRSIKWIEEKCWREILINV